MLKDQHAAVADIVSELRSLCTGAGAQRFLHLHRLTDGQQPDTCLKHVVAELKATEHPPVVISVENINNKRPGHSYLRQFASEFDKLACSPGRGHRD